MYRKTGEAVAKLKPSIYCLLAGERDLSGARGDVANERRFLKILSQRFDVYYNNQKIDWSKPNLGLRKRKIEPPSRKYDLHYVRNNPLVSLSIEGPQIVMAYPYDKEIWKKADALLATNWAWESSLQDFRAGFRTDEFDTWYPESVERVPPILVAEQYVPDEFFSRHEPRRGSMESTGRKGGPNIRIGFIGRTDPTSFPSDAIGAIEALRRRGRRINLTFWGPVRSVEVPRWARARRPVPYAKMPSKMRNFDILLYDQDITGNWLGSAKVLEAMAGGIPILVRRHRAREENLGLEYPLFYENQEDVQRLIEELGSSPTFVGQVQEYLRARAENYRFENVAKRFWADFERKLGNGLISSLWAQK